MPSSQTNKNRKLNYLFPNMAELKKYADILLHIYQIIVLKKDCKLGPTIYKS